jgi:hypothetical protein
LTESPHSLPSRISPLICVLTFESEIDFSCYS